MNKKFLPLIAVGAILLALSYFHVGGFSVVAGGSENLAGGNQWQLHNADVWLKPPGQYQEDVLLVEQEYSYNGVYTGWSYNQYAQDLTKLSETTFTRAGGILGLPGPPNIATLHGTNVLSTPSGENAQFKNLGVQPVFSNGAVVGFNPLQPIPKDSRLRLDAGSCDTSDLGPVTLVFQAFDASAGSRIISLSSFQHTVKRFCFQFPVSVKRADNNLEKITKPYADIILSGSATQPAGEVWVFQYLAPANEFPIQCPQGQALNGSECVPADVGFTCTGDLVKNAQGGYDCVFAHQTSPSCSAPLVYDWNLKQCTIQTAFCPQGSSFITPTQSSSPADPRNATGYCVDASGTGSEVDLNAFCAQQYGSNVGYDNGACAAAYVAISNNNANTPPAGGAGSVSTGPNWGFVLIVLVAGGVLFYLWRRKK